MVVFHAVLTIAQVLIGIYTYCFTVRTMKFYGLKADKLQIRILAAVFAAFIALLSGNVWSAGTVIIIHFIAFSLGLDVLALTGKIISGIVPDKRAGAVWKKLYGCGVLPFVFAGILLTYGFFNMGHAVKTEYQVETEKSMRDYKIVLITDTHYGTIQNPDVLKNKIEEINSQDPDIVILGGDIVEEGTSKEKMEEAFQILGTIANNCGIYYVYGNHDRQPYTQSRSYTDEELERAIMKNGITILEDSYTEINDDLILAGRGDAAWGNVSGRASTEDILQGADREKFIIVADHQPVEVEENDAQGVDLELSGHTHGGQIWPVGVLSELTGILNYGKYQKGDCKVIVSSGFTGWGYPIRTEEHCEYVVIHIKGASVI